MADSKMASQMSGKDGFIAALDQSGGSTPGALRAYGISDSAYSGDAEMFRLMHEMRVRIMTAPAFTGDKVIAAILFEGTMDGQAQGKPVPAFLWQERGIVPFVKVDKGLEAEKDGVRLMKPMPDLDTLLARAVKLGVYGTKMRSVIEHASEGGIAAIVRQQFEVGAQIAGHGLMPIIEPEVSIKSSDKAGAEAILRSEIQKQLDALPDGRKVMLKLTIPDTPDFYLPLIKDERVARVVALSGGYSREDACQRLARNHGLIASFSRALTEGLTKSMSDADFNATLEAVIDEIYPGLRREGLTPCRFRHAAFPRGAAGLSGRRVAGSCVGLPDRPCRTACATSVSTLMTKTITLREANQGFARCIRDVEGGEEYVVTRNGAPVARIVPVAAAKRVLTAEQQAARERFRARRGWPLGAGPLDRDALHER